MALKGSSKKKKAKKSQPRKKRSKFPSEKIVSLHLEKCTNDSLLNENIRLKLAKKGLKSILKKSFLEEEEMNELKTLCDTNDVPTTSKSTVIAEFETNTSRVKKLRKKSPKKRKKKFRFLSKVFIKDFKYFSTLGEKHLFGNSITYPKTLWWLRKAAILDDNIITVRDVEVHFINNLKDGYELKMLDFIRFLKSLCEDCELKMFTVLEQLLNCRKKKKRIRRESIPAMSASASSKTSNQNKYKGDKKVSELGKRLVKRASRDNTLRDENKAELALLLGAGNDSRSFNESVNIIENRCRPDRNSKTSFQNILRVGRSPSYLEVKEIPDSIDPSFKPTRRKSEEYMPEDMQYPRQRSREVRTNMEIFNEELQEHLNIKKIRAAEKGNERDSSALANLWENKEKRQDVHRKNITIHGKTLESPYDGENYEFIDSEFTSDEVFTFNDSDKRQLQEYIEKSGEHYIKTPEAYSAKSKQLKKCSSDLMKFLSTKLDTDQIISIESINKLPHVKKSKDIRSTPGMWESSTIKEQYNIPNKTKILYFSYPQNSQKSLKSKSYIERIFEEGAMEYKFVEEPNIQPTKNTSLHISQKPKSRSTKVSSNTTSVETSPPKNKVKRVSSNDRKETQLSKTNENRSGLQKNTKDINISSTYATKNPHTTELVKDGKSISKSTKDESVLPKKKSSRTTLLLTNSQKAEQNAPQKKEKLKTLEEESLLEITNENIDMDTPEQILKGKKKKTKKRRSFTNLPIRQVQRALRISKELKMKEEILRTGKSKSNANLATKKSKNNKQETSNKKHTRSTGKDENDIKVNTDKNDEVTEAESKSSDDSSNTDLYSSSPDCTRESEHEELRNPEIDESKNNMQVISRKEHARSASRDKNDVKVNTDKNHEGTEAESKSSDDPNDTDIDPGSPDCIREFEHEELRKSEIEESKNNKQVISRKARSVSRNKTDKKAKTDKNNEVTKALSKSFDDPCNTDLDARPPACRPKSETKELRKPEIKESKNNKRTMPYKKPIRHTSRNKICDDLHNADLDARPQACTLKSEKVELRKPEIKESKNNKQTMPYKRPTRFTSRNKINRKIKTGKNKDISSSEAVDPGQSVGTVTSKQGELRKPKKVKMYKIRKGVRLKVKDLKDPQTELQKQEGTCDEINTLVSM